MLFYNSLRKTEPILNFNTTLHNGNYNEMHGQIFPWILGDGVSIEELTDNQYASKAKGNN